MYLPIPGGLTKAPPPPPLHTHNNIMHTCATPQPPATQLWSLFGNDGKVEWAAQLQIKTVLVGSTFCFITILNTIPVKSLLFGSRGTDEDHIYMLARWIGGCHYWASDTMVIVAHRHMIIIIINIFFHRNIYNYNLPSSVVGALLCES